MKLCPKCHKHFSDDANFCPVDAARLSPLEAGAAGGAAADSLTSKYKLGDKIGGSRTGTVHRATDTGTGATAAVKLVSAEVAALPGVGARLERELKQLERVQSAGVAKVLASGKRTIGGAEQYWLAYELLDGAQTLAEAISARGAIPLAEAAHLVEVVGEALIEAAQVGVVHRDLAPKNVLFAGSEIKLINFSLPVPTSEKVPGVPEFVAPEQIDGKPVDQRSNLYSLGALYYYVLTGQTVHAGPAEEVHRAHVNAVIRTPSSLASVPAPVEAVIMRALDRSPTKRFLTVRQFVDEVGRIARGEADPKSTQPLGKVGRPKAELVQTLLGVRSIGGPHSQPVQAPVPTPSAAVIAASGSVTLGPGAGQVQASHVAAAAQPAAPPAVGVPPPQAGPAVGATTIGPGAVQAAVAQAPAPVAPVAPVAPAAPAAPAMLGSATIGPGAAQAAVASAPAVAPAPAPVIPTSASTAPGAGPAQDRSPWAPPGTGAPAAAPAAPAIHAAPAAPAPPVVSPAALAAPVVAAKPVMGATTAQGKKGKGAPPAEGKSKGKFRETMWFKKGELDAQAAQKSAEELVSTGKSSGADKADSLPIDERYKDDGLISRGDAEKYSLRTGATQMMTALRDKDPSASSTGTGVREDALIDEMKSGRTWVFAAIAAGIAGIVILILILAR